MHGAGVVFATLKCSKLTPISLLKEIPRKAAESEEHANFSSARVFLRHSVEGAPKASLEIALEELGST